MCCNCQPALPCNDSGIATESLNQVHEQLFDIKLQLKQNAEQNTKLLLAYESQKRIIQFVGIGFVGVGVIVIIYLIYRKPQKK